MNGTLHVHIPTNAQLYFTTAIAFIKLLNDNGINVSNNALNALRQFCGDSGFRPKDCTNIKNRKSDPRRYFWEEIDSSGRKELEKVFTENQNEITSLLLQKAYLKSVAELI